MVEARDGRRAAELLPRQRGGARRDRARACARPPAAPAARSRSCRTCPGPKLRIGKLRDGIVELKPGDDADVRVRRRTAARATRSRRMFITWAGLADAVDAGRDHVPRRRRRAPARDDHAPRATARSTPWSRSAARSPRARASTSPARRRRCRPCPRRTSSTCAPASGSASTSSRCRSCAAPRTSTFLRKHTRLPLIAKIEKPQAVQRAEEIVRAADCVMVARGDLGIEMRDRGGPDRAEAGHRAGRRARPPRRSPRRRCSTRWSPPRARRAPRSTDVANAILDGTDAVMLSQESAVGQYPVECGRDDGRDRRADRADRAVPRVERAARAPRPPRPRLHDRLHAPAARRTSSAWPRSCARRCRAARARLISAHRPTVPDLRALARPRDRAPLRADVGRAGGVDAPLRGDRGADRGGRRARASSSAGSSPATASASPPACPPASPGTTSLLQIQRSSASRPSGPRGVELGLLAAQLGHGRVAVHPLARDPVPVGARAQLRRARRA